MKRWSPLAVLSLMTVTVGAALLRVRPFGETDWWWHVDAGRAVLAEHTRTVAEFSSFHGPSRYVDPEWLFDVLAHALDAHGGTGLAVALTSVCAALSVLMVCSLVIELGGGVPAAILIASLAALATNWHFTARPQSVQLVFTPMTMWLAARVARRNSAGALVALHALFASWAQTHTSIVVAPAIAVLCVFGAWRTLGRGRVVGLALLAVWPFTGPFGFGVIQQVLLHADAADTTRYIFDMEPGSLRALFTLNQPGAAPLVALLGLGLVGFARPTKPQLGTVLLSLLGLLMMLTARRFAAVWALFAVPMAVAALRELTSRWLYAVAGALIAASLVSNRTELGTGRDLEAVPYALGDELARRDVRGRLFVEFADGAYLHWKLGDAVKVFIDGRTPVHFDADYLYAYRRGVRDAAVLQRLDAVYGFAAISLRRDRPACAELARSSTFGAVWHDEERVLFLKGAPQADTQVCVGAVDLKPRVGEAGAQYVEAWATLLAAGKAAQVRDEANAVVFGLGHEVAPAVRMKLAEACAVLGDGACVGSNAWRAAIEGVPGAMELLRSNATRVSEAQKERVDALLGDARP